MRFVINLLALAIVAGPVFGSDVDVAKHKARALLHLAALSRDRASTPKEEPCACTVGGPCNCGAACKPSGCGCGVGCGCLTYKAALAKARTEGLALVVWTNQPVAAQFPGAVCCRRNKTGEKAAVKIFAPRNGKLKLRHTLAGKPSARAVRRALYAPESAPVTQVPRRLPSGPVRVSGGC